MATTDGPGPFGRLLQAYRAAAGLSQEELAEQAGLSRRGISDLERGARRSPHPATVRRLVEALGLAESDRPALLGAANAASSSALAGAAVGTDAPANLPLQRTSDVRQQLAEARHSAVPIGPTRLPWVGREREMEVLCAALGQALEGRGS